MDICERHLGTILKTAEELSKAHDTYPTLYQIQVATGLSHDEIVAALEYEPIPLGWHLATIEEEEDHEHGNKDKDGVPFIIRGQPCGLLIINRVHYDHPQQIHGDESEGI